MNAEERQILTAIRDDLLRRAAEWERKPCSRFNLGVATGMQHAASEITHYLEATE